MKVFLLNTNTTFVVVLAKVNTPFTPPETSKSGVGYPTEIQYNLWYGTHNV